MLHKRSLLRAISKNHFAKVEKLLARHPALIHEKREYNFLEQAVHYHPLFTALQSASDAMVYKLVDAGANLLAATPDVILSEVNDKRIKCDNALMAASYLGRNDVVKTWLRDHPAVWPAPGLGSEIAMNGAILRGDLDMALWLHTSFYTQGYSAKTSAAFIKAAEQSRDMIMLAYISAAFFPPVEPQTEAAVPAVGDDADGWHLFGTQAVARVVTGADGVYKMTEIFNFESMERTRLYSNTTSGVEAPPDNRDFAAMSAHQHDVVLAARDALAAGTGRAPDRDVVAKVLGVAAPRAFINKRQGDNNV